MEEKLIAQKFVDALYRGQLPYEKVRMLIRKLNYPPKKDQSGRGLSII